jgi:hypothetical protein
MTTNLNQQSPPLALMEMLDHVVIDANGLID